MSNRLSSTLMLFAGEPTHWCPGCRMMHRISVNKPNERTGARWAWNGAAERPTFEPSINVQATRCHYYLREGQLQFLADSQHALAGQTVPLPPIPGDELDA